MGHFSQKIGYVELPYMVRNKSLTNGSTCTCTVTSTVSTYPIPNHSQARKGCMNDKTDDNRLSANEVNHENLSVRH